MSRSHLSRLRKNALWVVSVLAVLHYTLTYSSLISTVPLFTPFWMETLRLPRTIPLLRTLCLLSRTKPFSPWWPLPLPLVMRGRKRNTMPCTATIQIPNQTFLTPLLWRHNHGIGPGLWNMKKSVNKTPFLSAKTQFCLHSSFLGHGTWNVNDVPFLSTKMEFHLHSMLWGEFHDHGAAPLCLNNHGRTTCSTFQGQKLQFVIWFCIPHSRAEHRNANCITFHIPWDGFALPVSCQFSENWFLEVWSFVAKWQALPLLWGEKVPVSTEFSCVSQKVVLWSVESFLSCGKNHDCKQSWVCTSQNKN